MRKIGVNLPVSNYRVFQITGIYVIQIISPLAKAVGNISAAVQCAPRSDCGMDGRRRLLRRETVRTGGLFTDTRAGNLSQRRGGFLSGPSTDNELRTK